MKGPFKCLVVQVFLSVCLVGPMIHLLASSDYRQIKEPLDSHLTRSGLQKNKVTDKIMRERLKPRNYQCLRCRPNNKPALGESSMFAAKPSCQYMLDGQLFRAPCRNRTVTSISADGPPVRVLIFAYYRGGTALMDELFTPLENMAHHNEPLKSFYQAVKGSLEYPVIISGNDTYREISEMESHYLAVNMLNLLNCDLDKLPVEYFLDSNRFASEEYAGMKEFQACVKQSMAAGEGSGGNHGNMSGEMSHKECVDLITNYCKAADCVEEIEVTRQTQGDPSDDPKGVGIAQAFPKHWQCLQRKNTYVHPCVHNLKPRCKATSVSVAMETRMSMEYVEAMLRLDPHLKVLYLTRDPRGQAYAKARVDHTLKSSSWTYDSRKTCARVAHDFDISLRLRQRHPRNFMTVMYEDLAASPRECAEKIYKYLNLPVTAGLVSHMDKVAQKDRLTAMGASPNALNTAQVWRSVIGQKYLDAVNNVPHCQRALNMMNIAM